MLHFTTHPIEHFIQPCSQRLRLFLGVSLVSLDPGAHLGSAGKPGVRLVSLSPFVLPSPVDPWLWTEQQVCQWLLWATNEFSLVDVNLQRFGMTGQVLCNLGKERFLELAPDFVGDILWEHLEQMIKGICPATGLPGGMSVAGKGWGGALGALQLWGGVVSLSSDVGQSCLQVPLE